MVLGDRIKKLRKSLDLTQQQFANKIGSTQNILANYETGRRNPSNSVVNNISKTFNVSEEWLRYGTGEIFIKQSREEELTFMVNNFLSGEHPDFKRRLINVLSSLNEDQWEILEKKLLEIVDYKKEKVNLKSIEQKNINNEDITQYKPYLKNYKDIEKEVERYRQELELEKRAKEKSSVLRDIDEV